MLQAVHIGALGTHLREATLWGIMVKFPSNTLFQSRNCPLEPSFSCVALELRDIEIAENELRYTVEARYYIPSKCN